MYFQAKSHIELKNTKCMKSELQRERDVAFSCFPSNHIPAPVAPVKHYGCWGSIIDYSSKWDVSRSTKSVK